jgi:hypothetical protein
VGTLLVEFYITYNQRKGSLDMIFGDTRHQVKCNEKKKLFLTSYWEQSKIIIPYMIR